MEKTIARLPDLHWPLMLFTDMSFMPAEMTMAPATARPDLWREMASTWSGAAPCPVLAWRVPPAGIQSGLSIA